MLAENWQFGRFRLEPDRRLLLADGVPLPLNSRAFDILELLVRNHDRVVGRDEIVAHVWRGVIVGDNNLAVQMSGLRRALGDHVDGQPLIVNLPGRGYRLVAEVWPAELGQAGVEPGAGAAARIAHQPGDEAAGGPVRPPPASRSWRRLVIGAVIPLAVAGIFALRGLIAPTGRDARLTISVHRFVSDMADPQMSRLAVLYNDIVVTRFAPYEELKLFPETSTEPWLSKSRFELTGSVGNEGGRSVLAIGLTERPSGRLLYRRSFPIAAAATRTEQSTVAMQIVAGVRPVVFHAEAARIRGRPHDPLDLLIQAHDLIGASRQRDSYSKAIALAARAAASPDADRAARAYYAYLLNVHVTLTGARTGDAQARQALVILDHVLQEQPFNTLYLLRRMDVLGTLGRLREADATAGLALKIDPDDAMIQRKYAEILILEGNVAAAKSFLAEDPSNPQDDIKAELAFIEGRYTDCLDLVRSVIAGAPPASDTPFNILLEVSTLGLLGRVQEAKRLLSEIIALIPDDLRTISSQRQTTYMLPSESWRNFKAGLAEAGMAP